MSKIDGLKSARGNGKHQRCENCKCNRYGECGCHKPTAGSKSQQRKANRLAGKK